MRDDRRRREPVISLDDRVDLVGRQDFERSTLGVEKAGGKPPEPPVSEASIRLLLQQPEPVEVSLLDGSLDKGVEQQVSYVVAEGAPDQKFHRQIIDALRVLSIVAALGRHPPWG